jgi:hypothetical protein
MRVAPATVRPRREKSFIGRHFERGFTKVRNGYEKPLDWRCAPLRGADDGASAPSR